MGHREQKQRMGEKRASYFMFSCKNSYNLEVRNQENRGSGSLVLWGNAEVFKRCDFKRWDSSFHQTAVRNGNRFQWAKT